MKMANKDSISLAAKEFLSFVNKTPSPFHVVEECKKRLISAGFKELLERDTWILKPLDKYFVTKNQSTLIGFAIGGKFEPGSGFSIIGAHTDSPCLKVKPCSKVNKQGYLGVGVQLYGGGIWHSWFDRDLKLAGRVIIKTNENKIDQKLVHIDRPILRIPNIAIHLQREQNEKFEFNKETHLVPVLATLIQHQLENPKSENDACDKAEKIERGHPVLLDLLVKELNVKAEQILDYELCIADATPGVIGGLYDEFIFAARLDNNHSTYCSLTGMIESIKGDNLILDQNIRMVSLFDNEEVGSESAQGAASAFQENVLRRVAANLGGKFEESMARSILVSADMAHAVHPNYGEKHEEQHRPQLHKGVVLKFNANQRYATTTVTATIIREIASRINCPLQDFVIRNDSLCGSTIGPIMATRLGIHTMDLGSPQLSMHSIREMCDVSSVLQATGLFKAFYETYPEVYNSFITL